MDVARKFAAHRDLCPFDPINPGISARTTAFHADFQSRNKSEIHEMFGYRMIELQLANNGAFADLKVGKGTRGTFFALPASEYEVENHFQFQLYSNPILPPGNDQSHNSL